jgi:hypothetical protein
VGSVSDDCVGLGALVSLLAGWLGIFYVPKLSGHVPAEAHTLFQGLPSPDNQRTILKQGQVARSGTDRDAEI